MRRCSIDGCGKPHDARGYCRSHYGSLVACHVDRGQCSVAECKKKARYAGYCTTHYERHRKYGDPSVIKQRPNGHGSQTGTGYWHTMKSGVRKQDHVWIAEKALGKPLPAGAVVHHWDENRLNNDPGNLVICPSKAYHALLHKRMRALDACGHAGWERCWICKAYSNPASMRECRRADGTGYFYHAACHKERGAENYRKRKAARG